MSYPVESWTPAIWTTLIFCLDLMHHIPVIFRIDGFLPPLPLASSLYYFSPKKKPSWIVPKLVRSALTLSLCSSVLNHHSPFIIHHSSSASSYVSMYVSYTLPIPTNGYDQLPPSICNPKRKEK